MFQVAAEHERLLVYRADAVCSVWVVLVGGEFEAESLSRGREEVAGRTIVSCPRNTLGV